MRRQLCSLAFVIGAMLLDPFGDLRERRVGYEEAGLERLTAAPELEVTADAAPPARNAHHDIPLSGGRMHLIVDGTLNGTVRGPMLVDTGASYCVVTRRTA